MKILLFNPRAAKYKYRIPNSILAVASVLEGRYEYIIVDGNRETDPWPVIEKYLRTEQIDVFGCTVMPGPQLKQAIPLTRRIRETFPEVVTVWGGYFPANHPKVCLQSGYVDYIINGPGEAAFPQLLRTLENSGDIGQVPNLVFLRDNEPVKTVKPPLPDQDELPDLPYDSLNRFYDIGGYLGKTFLGNRTAAYHSSVGCPFTCSFCAVVPVYEARWKGQSPDKIYRHIKYLKDEHGADAIEFHDNNFFVSEKRAVDFARLIEKENMRWWGEARIDTMHGYRDSSLKKLRDAGCVMIFFGAETGSDEVLKKMDKGGTQSAGQIKEFTARLKRVDIIPEYSFVLGLPGDSPQAVMEQIEADIGFIKELKLINPATEIILYLYSPVAVEGSELYSRTRAAGFRYPRTLEEWIAPQWEQFDLRRNPLTPWLTPAMVRLIQDFETVLNARYPTVSDTKLSNWQRRVVRELSGWRYRLNRFSHPWELRLLQSRWLRYRRPEMEGF